MLPCETAEDRMYISKTAAPYFYLLPEKLLPSFLRLDAGYRNPYINRIQEIMDECFAAGLHQAWDLFYGKIQKIESKSHEIHAINFKDVKPVFVILFMGHVIALLTFIVENILNTIQQYVERRATVIINDVILPFVLYIIK